MSFVFPGVTVSDIVKGQGLTSRRAVRVATTANGTLATAFANGQVIDGVTLVTGNRILLKDQTTGTQNGVYVVTVGLPTRADDFRLGESVGSVVYFVNEGTTNGKLEFRCTNNDASDVVGTDALVFSSSINVILDNTATSGLYPTAPQSDGVWYGTGTKALTTSTSVALGNAASANFAGAVAIGQNAKTGATNQIAIGNNSDAGNQANSMVIGDNAGSSTMTGFDNTGVGYNSLNVCTSGYFHTSLGSRSLQNISSGLANTAIGARAMIGKTTASDCVAVGYQALNGSGGRTSGNSNIGVGVGAGDLNTGDNNTYIGASTGGSTGNNNVAIGWNAFRGPTGDSNIVMGLFAFDNIAPSSGNDNIVLGQSAAGSLLSGSNNILIGRDSDVNSGSRSGSIALGQGIIATADNGFFVKHRNAVTPTAARVAVYDNVTNEVVGLPFAGGTGYLLTSNAAGAVTWAAPAAAVSPVIMDNTAAGNDYPEAPQTDGVWYGTGTKAAGVATSVRLGNSTSALATNSIAIGDTAVVNSKYGISMGTYSGTGSGDSNIMMGFLAGKVFTQVNSFSFGAAMPTGPTIFVSSTTGFPASGNITAISTTGFFAGTYTGITASTLTGVSWPGGESGTLTPSSTGYIIAMDAVPTGSDNIGIGDEVLSTLTSGGTNTVVGSKAGSLITSGSNNTLFGSSAGDKITTGYSNIAIGPFAGRGIQTGFQNIAIGRLALSNASANVGSSEPGGSGSNVAIGFEALRDADAGTYRCTAVGDGAGTFGKGNRCTYIGFSADSANSTDLSVTALGQNSTAATQGVSIGVDTGLQIIGGTPRKTGSSTVNIGYFATGLGPGSVCIGVGASMLNSASLLANASVHIGNHSGWTNAATLTTTDSNVAIGTNTLGGLTYTSTSASNNVIVGTNAAKFVSSASNNVIVGDNAAATLTTGGQNVLIGRLANVNAAGRSGAVALGDSITATVDNGFFVKHRNAVTPTAAYVGVYDSVSNELVGLPFAGGSGYLLTSNAAGAVAWAAPAAGVSPVIMDNTATGNDYPEAPQTDGVWYGTGTKAAGVSTSVRLGNSTSALATNSIAIGDTAVVNSKYGISMGTYSGTGSGDSNIMMGFLAGKVFTQVNSFSFGAAMPTGPTIFVSSTTGFPASGNITAISTTGFFAGTYTGITASTLTGVSWPGGESGTLTPSSTGYIIAMDAVPTGSDNIGIGDEVLSTLTSGGTNTVVGSKAGSLITSGSNNTLFGSSAGDKITTGYSNIAIGPFAGRGIQTGFQNIAIGRLALSNASANVGSSEPGGSGSNVAIGFEALRDADAGTYRCTAVGDGAGTFGKGNRCTYIGFSADSANSTDLSVTALGQNSTAATQGVSIGVDTGLQIIGGTPRKTGSSTVNIGYFATGLGPGSVCIGVGASMLNSASLLANASVHIGNHSGWTNAATLTTTDSNVAIGTNTLGGLTYTSTSASNNVIVGTNAAKFVSSASNNVIVGDNAAASLTTGGSNIIVGDNADVGAANTGSIVIGKGASSSFADSVVIGRAITDTVNAGLFMRHRGPVTATVNVAGWIAGNNELVEITSSRRYKQDIRDLEAVSDKIDLLRPVRYRPEEGHGDINEEHLGFIAEEVEELYPEVVTKDAEGLTSGMMYDRLLPVLLKEIQELRKRVADLEAK